MYPEAAFRIRRIIISATFKRVCIFTSIPTVKRVAGSGRILSNIVRALVCSLRDSKMRIVFGSIMEIKPNLVCFLSSLTFRQCERYQADDHDHAQKQGQ